MLPRYYDTFSALIYAVRPKRGGLGTVSERGARKRVVERLTVAVEELKLLV